MSNLAAPPDSRVVPELPDAVLALVRLLARQAAAEAVRVACVDDDQAGLAPNPDSAE